MGHNLDNTPNFSERASFEEYSKKYAEHCIMERRDGAIMLRFHSEGKAIVWSPQIHRTISEAVREAGADPENELMIITGTGDFWIAYSAGPDEIGDFDEDSEAGRAEMTSRLFMGDGIEMIKALVNDVPIPSIGVINGPGYHMEVPLFCDITIASEQAVLVDVHRWAGIAPGDGINIAYEALMGPKRAAYAMLMTQGVTAQQALDWGLVNEVVPHDQTEQRAWEIAAFILRDGKSRSVERRMTTAIIRKHWQVRIAADLVGAMAAESFAYMLTPAASHDEDRIKRMFEHAGVTLPATRR